MRYLNQLDYPHIPYRTRVKVEGLSEEERLRTVARSGCGLCSACMVVELLTNHTLEIEDCVKLSEECEANHAVGTDMRVLGPVIADKFGLSLATAFDPNEAVQCLRAGGAVIVHVRVPANKKIGLFTNGGHYIVLVSTDGEEFCVLDPSYTPEKFEHPDRVGRVDTSHAPYLYCDVGVLDAETVADGRPKYYLFSRKRA